MDFKLRNLSNVCNHVYNIWQQTGQSNFLETVFFYHPQHAFGFGPASARSFSIQPEIFFYICFYFKRCDQLRVIIICCVLKVFLPVRIRLKIVTFKPLKNNQLVLSTSYADLSAFFALHSVWANKLDWSVLPSCLRIICQYFMERQLRACSQIFKGTRCWPIQKPKKISELSCLAPIKWSELM